MAKIGTVWDRTAEFLSDNLQAVLPIALLAFFVPATIQGNFDAARQGASFQLSLALYLVQLAFGILSLWGTLTISALALEISDGRSAGTIGRARLLPALAVSVVLLAGTVLLLVPLWLVMAARGVDYASLLGGFFLLDPWISRFVALYLLGFGVVALWLSARLFVYTPVIVRERRMFSALARSWKLTRGMTWRIIGVLLLFMLVSWVCALAAKTVFGSIFALLEGAPADGLSLSGVLTSIVGAAVQSSFTVLVPAFTAKLYLALTSEAGLREGVVTA